MASASGSPRVPARTTDCATRHYFCASSGQQVECREILEHAHRVVGAEHSDRTGKTNAFRARCGRSKNYCWGRSKIVGTMMLADSENIEADLIGELDLFE